MAGVFSVDHLVFQQASTITHCNLVPLVPNGICVKSYYYYSVQFVRKKALAALSVKILKHRIQRNLSMCTRNWQKTNHSCTVNRTAGELHSQRWTTKSSI